MNLMKKILPEILTSCLKQKFAYIFCLFSRTTFLFEIWKASLKNTMKIKNKSFQTLKPIDCYLHFRGKLRILKMRRSPSQ